MRRLQQLIFKIHNYVRFGITDLFSNVEMETASRCNRACVYCPNSRFDRGDHFMSEALFKKIIRQLEELHFSGIFRPHFYNEPLLDKRLPKLIRYTRKHLPYCTIHVYTNGDFLTKKLFATLRKAGVDKFLVTAHSGFFTQEVHALLKSADVPHHIEGFTIKPGQALFNRAGLVNVSKLITSKTCNLAAKYLVINFKGDVALCCNDYLTSNSFGNLARESVVNVWRKPEYRSVRQTTKKGLFTLEICRVCMGLKQPSMHTQMPRQPLSRIQI